MARQFLASVWANEYFAAARFQPVIGQPARERFLVLWPRIACIDVHVTGFALVIGRLIPEVASHYLITVPVLQIILVYRVVFLPGLTAEAEWQQQLVAMTGRVVLPA